MMRLCSAVCLLYHSLANVYQRSFAETGDIERYQKHKQNQKNLSSKGSVPSLRVGEREEPQDGENPKSQPNREPDQPNEPGISLTVGKFHAAHLAFGLSPCFL